MPMLPSFEDKGWPLVGVVHLAPLPGSPRWEGSMHAVVDRALRDAEAYVAGGFDGFIVENYGDRPFAPATVPPATVAAMAAVASRLRDCYPAVHVGINVLRNDALSAMSIAKAVGAHFVRINVLVGAMITDQGVIEGDAWGIAQLSRLLEADDIALWADVMVKHAAPLGDQTLEGQADDAFKRGGASALVLSGRATGTEADATDFVRLRAMLPEAPLIVGSGLSVRNFDRFREVADGAIVASALYGTDGRIDQAKVRDLASVRDAKSARAKT